MKANLKAQKNLIRRFNRKLNMLSGRVVEVGHFAGDKHPTADVDYATLAKWLEYGTEGGIKAYRPLAAVHLLHPIKNDKSLQKLIMKYLKETGLNVNQVFEAIGEEYEKLLKQTYGDTSVLPSNSKETIRDKNGRDTPLIDTGLLRDAITHKIKRI